MTKRATAESEAFNKALGATLDGIRKERGLQLRNIAEALGVSGQQVSKYVTGSDAISAYRLSQLAAILDTSVEAILKDIETLPASLPAEVKTGNDHAYLAAHFVRKMSAPVAEALLAYMRNIVYLKPTVERSRAP